MQDIHRQTRATLWSELAAYRNIRPTPIYDDFQERMVTKGFCPQRPGGDIGQSNFRDAERTGKT